MRQVGGWRSVCYYLDTAAECGEASGLDQAVEDQQTSSTRPQHVLLLLLSAQWGFLIIQTTNSQSGQSDNFLTEFFHLVENLDLLHLLVM